MVCEVTETKRFAMNLMAARSRTLATCYHRNRAMDQVSRIIARFAGIDGVISHERIACTAWKRAVGKRIALRTRALKLVRTTLVIEVEDEIWRKNLWSLRYQIIHNLAKAIGPEIVTDVELRVRPPRRGPQREAR